MKKTILALTSVLVFLLTTTGVALAWPNQPPDRATISGPSLKGEVEITDKDVLAALKLGMFEELAGPQRAAPPVSGEGYTIKLWFYGGEFNFATLHYYPDPAGGNGYVRWDDGPDLTGNHTEFNGQWLRVTPRGEAAMRKLLLGLGVSLAVKPQPLSSTSISAIDVAAAPVVIGGLALIVVVSGMLIWRVRAGAARSTAARHTD